MAFEYAYSLDGTIAPVVVDLPLETLANYKTAAPETNGVKRGDLVFIDATSGLLKRTKSGSGILATGVIEGKEFLGLVAAGQDYAAVNSSFTAEVVSTTRFPNGVGKVNIDKTTVYRVPASAAATNANIGKSYGITNAASGDQTVNLSDTTNTVVKVIDYRTLNGINYVYVTINSTATI